MVEASHSLNHDMAMDSVVPKSESLRDVSISSSVSTPEADAEAVNRDMAQTHKRKGGRKPVRYINWSFDNAVMRRMCLLQPRRPFPYMEFLSYGLGSGGAIPACPSVLLSC